jgi:hypothetical protein
MDRADPGHQRERPPRRVRGAERARWIPQGQALQPGQYGGGPYALAPAPDGSVWGTMFGFPGAVFRLTPGPNPPETALTEVFELPWNNPAVAEPGLLPARRRRGPQRRVLGRPGERAHGQLRPAQVPRSAERPTATGQHCPEGWTFYAEPLPQLGNVTSPGVRRELLHVGGPVQHARPRRERADQHREPVRGAARAQGRGVGRPARPLSDGLLHQVAGRPHRRSDAGWKGRGLWAAISTRAPFHMEGGKGTTSKAIQFQLRPDPLAAHRAHCAHAPARPGSR